MQPASEPAWLTIARMEMGVREVVGRKHSARVLEYHATTRLKATADEVPWCSSFVCWALEQAGVPSTRSAAAKSWLQWGQSTYLETGAVAVLNRGAQDAGATGHVGFVVGWNVTRVRLLGGNQGNAVSIREYPLAQLCDRGLRWPRPG